MPKVATKATKRARATGTTKGTEGGPVSANTDPSCCRASKIRIDATIIKSHAMSQYRLKSEHLNGLTVQRRRSKVPGQNDMQIYQERDVERRAWERHGGPEGFEAYLEKLYQRHAKSKNAHNSFTQPTQYSFGCKAAASLHSSGHDQLSATVSRTQKSMDPWLFDAVRKALGRNEALTYELSVCGIPFESLRDERMPYVLAEKFASTYPGRPSTQLPSSPSVDAVRTILADAATPPSRYGPDSRWGEVIDGLDFRDDCEEEYECYEWSAEYLERLFSALIRVIEEHGFGDEGWKGIRWEVYDKCAATLKGPISYDADHRKWEDAAAHWLDGQFTTEGEALNVANRRCCPAGLRYNAMLPYVHESGGVHVGWPQY